MTFLISDNPPRVQATATAAQTVFTVNFEFRANTDLVVYVDGVLKVLNTHYTVAGAATTGGGTVTFVTPMVGGEVVVIYRDMPIARTTEQFATGGQMPGEVVEASLDDVTMKMQQVERDLGRALRLQVHDTANPGDFLLPLAAARGNKFLKFDADGKPQLVDSGIYSVGDAIFVSTVGGDANNITLTTGAGLITSYFTGLTVLFFAAANNTGNVDLSINGLGNRDVRSDPTTELPANTLVAGTLQTVVYDGTRFILTSFIRLPSVISPTSIELGNADTTLDRGSAGVMRVEGQPVITQATGDARYLKQGRGTIPISAAAMTPAVTNGAPSGTIETVTNRVVVPVLDFDQTTQEFAAFVIPMPKQWNRGTLTFQPLWTAAAGAGGVVWALQAVAISNDDPIEVAYGTEQTSIDTLIAANDVHIGPESAAITVAGAPAVDDLIAFRIKRNPADASDTLTADARLIGIRLYWTSNAADDA